MKEDQFYFKAPRKVEEVGPGRCPSLPTAAPWWGIGPPVRDVHLLMMCSLQAEIE